MPLRTPGDAELAREAELIMRHTSAPAARTSGFASVSAGDAEAAKNALENKNRRELRCQDCVYWIAMLEVRWTFLDTQCRASARLKQDSSAPTSAIGKTVKVGAVVMTVIICLVSLAVVALSAADAIGTLLWLYRWSDSAAYEHRYPFLWEQWRSNRGSFLELLRSAPLPLINMTSGVEQARPLLHSGSAYMLYGDAHTSEVVLMFLCYVATSVVRIVVFLLFPVVQILGLLNFTFANDHAHEHALGLIMTHASGRIKAAIAVHVVVAMVFKIMCMGGLIMWAPRQWFGGGGTPGDSVGDLGEDSSTMQWAIAAHYFRYMLPMMLVGFSSAPCMYLMLIHAATAAAVEASRSRHDLMDHLRAFIAQEEAADEDEGIEGGGDSHITRSATALKIIECEERSRLRTLGFRDPVWLAIANIIFSIVMCVVAHQLLLTTQVTLRAQVDDWKFSDSFVILALIMIVIFIIVVASTFAWPALEWNRAVERVAALALRLNRVLSTMPTKRRRRRIEQLEGEVELSEMDSPHALLLAELRHAQPARFFVNLQAMMGSSTISKEHALKLMNIAIDKYAVRYLAAGTAVVALLPRMITMLAK